MTALERLPERAVVVRMLKKNTWDSSTSEGPWMAAMLGDDDYICMGSSFIDTSLMYAVFAETAETAAQKLLEELKL